MSHSPGPWKPTEVRCRYGTTGIDGIEDANGRLVLRIDEETWSETESTKYIDASDDDMALILAAPSLLEALDAVLDWYDNCGGPRQEEEAINAARAAIAKATTPAPPTNHAE